MIECQFVCLAGWIEHTLKKTEYTEEKHKMNLRNNNSRFYDFLYSLTIADSTDTGGIA